MYKTGFFFRLLIIRSNIRKWNDKEIYLENDKVVHKGNYFQVLYTILCIQILNIQGVKKQHETWNTTWGLFKGISGNNDMG